MATCPVAPLTRDAVRQLVVKHFGSRPEMQETGSYDIGNMRIETLVNIAYLESGFCPRAHARDSDDDSYGLMQINMLGGLGPARLRQFGISSADQLFDPDTNMRAARLLMDESMRFQPEEGLFAPWSTANRAMDAAMKGTKLGDAVLGATTGGLAGGGFATGVGRLAAGDIDIATALGLPNTIGGLSAVFGALGRLLGALLSGEWWRRIGIGAAGVALIIAAIVLANKDTIAAANPVTAAASAAAK